MAKRSFGVIARAPIENEAIEDDLARGYADLDSSIVNLRIARDLFADLFANTLIGTHSCAFFPIVSV
jgi:hypothetical protein